jgi:hypothetical protein
MLLGAILSITQRIGKVKVTTSNNSRKGREWSQGPTRFECACLALEEVLVVFAEHLLGNHLQQREARQGERQPINSPLRRKLHPDQGEERCQLGTATGGCCAGGSSGAILHVRCGQEELVASPAHRCCTICANLARCAPQQGEGQMDALTAACWCWAGPGALPTIRQRMDAQCAPLP